MVVVESVHFASESSLLARKDEPAGDQAKTGQRCGCEIFDAHNETFFVVGIFDLRNRVYLENFDPVLCKTRMRAGLKPDYECRQNQHRAEHPKTVPQFVTRRRTCIKNTHNNIILAQFRGIPRHGHDYHTTEGVCIGSIKRIEFPAVLVVT